MRTDKGPYSSIRGGSKSHKKIVNECYKVIVLDIRQTWVCDLGLIPAVYLHEQVTFLHLICLICEMGIINPYHRVIVGIR